MTITKDIRSSTPSYPNFLKFVFRILFLLWLLWAESPAVLAQTQKPATEQWSSPTKIFENRWRANSYGTISDYPTSKLFYLDTTIAEANWKDTGWQFSKFLGISNASYLAKHPSISRSGDLLYYIDWKSGGYGEWDLYVSRYDSTTDRWGPGQLLPAPVNSPKSEWCAYAPNDTTLLIGRGTVVGTLQISYKTGPDQIWTEPKILSNQRITQGNGPYGITATRNLEKIYLGRYTRIDDRMEFDLMVSYWDSTEQQYTYPKSLNINVDRSSDDQDPNSFKDWFPSISLDGEYMIFTSTRDTNQYGYHVHHIYQTRLLVDENGDSVHTALTEPPPHQKPASFELLGNYPNPFNNQTNIRFHTYEPQNLIIRIYNIKGSLIQSIQSTYYNPGIHIQPVQIGTQSSGVYFYKVSNQQKTKMGTLTFIK